MFGISIMTLGSFSTESTLELYYRKTFPMYNYMNVMFIAY